MFTLQLINPDTEIINLNNRHIRILRICKNIELLFQVSLCFRLNGVNYCSQTAEELSPWWAVELAQPYNILAVYIGTVIGEDESIGKSSSFIKHPLVISRGQE